MAERRDNFAPENKQSRRDDNDNAKPFQRIGEISEHQIAQYGRADDFKIGKWRQYRGGGQPGREHDQQMADGCDHPDEAEQ